MRRKAQEEIVGFVLIVVIVAIIFLVFLGIAIRQPGTTTPKESRDVAQFLGSIMEYTSECTVSYEPAYLDLGELLKECYTDSECRSEREACEVLEETLKAAISTNWKIGPERPVKGYVFNSSYVSEGITREVIYVSDGACGTERVGAEYLTPVYPGNIRSVLDICY